jgi:site-specific DNA-methyltransferase (adenine-specific)
MIEPYYEKDGITIYHGDCREILPTLGRFDLLLTDPPYGMNWKFSGQGSGRQAQGGTNSAFKNKTVTEDDIAFDPSFLLDYPAVIVWGFHHYPQYLTRGSVIVWRKKYDDALGTFLSDADVAWMKGGCGVYVSPVVNPATFQSERQHPTQKPLGLMRWCIEKATNRGSVCDPFMGSGTTLRAAKDLGRRAVGIEIEERYCEIAAKRLAQGVFAFDEVSA